MLVTLGSVLPASAQESEGEGASVRSDAAPDEERSARARAAFAQGRDAYTAGRFEVALVFFEEAYSLEPHAELLFNLANAHDRLGQLTEALRRYREYRAAIPEAENIEFVSRRIQLIEERMDATAEASVTRSSEPSPEPSASDPDLGPAIAVLSIAGVVGLAGVGTGIGSFVVRDDIAADCVDSVCPGSRRDDADTMQSLAIATDVLIGASLIGIAIGVVLLLTADGGDEAAAACGPAGCAAVIRF